MPDEITEAPDADGTIVVGLVADPGLCTRVAETLAGDLPGVLSRQVSNSVEWNVRLSTDIIPLDAYGDLLMIQYARDTMHREGWHLLVYVTDLPQRVGTRPVLAEFSVANGAAQISLPAVGWFRLRPNVRDTVVYLVARMISERLAARGGDGQMWPGLARLRLAAQVSPVRRIPSADEGIDGHLALTGTRGRLRLLFGMVRDNRPWRLYPACPGRPPRPRVSPAS